MTPSLLAGPNCAQSALSPKFLPRAGSLGIYTTKQNVCALPSQQRAHRLTQCIVCSLFLCTMIVLAALFLFLTWAVESWPPGGGSHAHVVACHMHHVPNAGDWHVLSSLSPKQCGESIKTAFSLSKLQRTQTCSGGMDNPCLITPYNYN